MNPRIGDEIDDYCPRCRLLTNHTVAALVGDQIAHSACRTCSHTHEYRQGKVPAPRSKTKVSAFDQVLAGILGEQAPAPVSKPRSRRTR